MTKNELLHLKMDLCQFGMVEPVELLSEEARPSLYSLSLTGSICSGSSANLDAVDDNYVILSTKDDLTKSEVQPPCLENNFMAESNVYNSFNANEFNNYPGHDTSTTLRKSMSMHNVSDILPLQLTAKSVNTLSCETIHSQSLSSTSKSKDSGFQRTVSCLSLTSARRNNYDHVQSKVRAYIRNIKESEALRKKNKMLQKTETSVEPITVDEIDTVLKKEDLITKIQELKSELHEKALYIDAQQKNYNSLLLKLAEAKNTIESLRLQRLSLNYSSLNQSQPLCSKLEKNIDVLIHEMNRTSKGSGQFNLINELNSSLNMFKKQPSFAAGSPSSSLTESFKPTNHSTPDNKKGNKCLSPVSKIFCSSSRLDKHHKPLGKLNRQEKARDSIVSHSECITRKLKPLSLKDKYKSKQSTVRRSSETTLACHQPSRINLPNDDPFDKVKKWQASLPSINLLVTQSSSDSEELLSKTCPPSKEPDAYFSQNSFSLDKEKEVEINYLLSQELVTKCRISEQDLNYNSENCSEKTNQNVSGLNAGYFKNNKRLVISKNKKYWDRTYFSEKDEDTKLSSCKAFTQSKKEDCFKSKLCQRVNDMYGHQPNMLSFRNLSNSSLSENESCSNLPRSSQTRTADKILKDDLSDDSSSVSSSVLGSNNSASKSSPAKRSKLSNSSQHIISNKIPKLSKSKTMNFVLREPMLNVTLPDSNILTGKHARLSQSTNDITNTKNYDCNQSANIFLKTESSQRKAWNARNDADFYVCKDFPFKRSSSMEECLSVMGKMLETCSSIANSALDRSISQLNSR